MIKAVRWLDAKLSYPTGPSQRATMNWIEEELLLRRKSPELML
jgi:hypothetical protein